MGCRHELALRDCPIGRAHCRHYLHIDVDRLIASDRLVERGGVVLLIVKAFLRRKTHIDRPHGDGTISRDRCGVRKGREAKFPDCCRGA